MKQMIILLFRTCFRNIKSLKIKFATNKQFQKISKGLVLKHLTKEQKSEIRNYYKQTLGVKVNTKWHQLAYSLTGIYDKHIIPNDLYVRYIQQALIDYRIKIAYDDKNLFIKLLPFAHFPKKILQCANGLFYNSTGAMSKEDAIKICQNIDKSILKPTLGSNSGRDVVMLSVKNGITNINNRTIEEIFNIYGKNFVIEELVNQHPSMASLNPSSINTLRVISFRKDNEILICKIICRIGKPGNIMDNFAQGGMACNVKNDGFLDNYAYTKVFSERRNTTYTGITLNKFQIPGLSGVIDFVKKAHLAIPHFLLLAWDIAIGENSEPIFIEYNTNFDNGIAIELGQALFGNYTDEILPIIRKEYDSRKKQRIYVC